MPEIGGYNIWDAATAVGIAIGSAFVTLGGMLGFQRKNAVGVDTRHDNSRTAIRALQDRCKDLENEVRHLKEKVTDQATLIKEAEAKQDALAKLMFDKLDTMNETLVAIRVALGIAERH